MIGADVTTGRCACDELTEELLRARTCDARRTVIERQDLRASAVLAPLICVDGVWHFVLTRRTEDLEHHRGQISFPGGAADPGETAQQTALREAWEEIGLASEHVDVLCLVDDRWTPSGFCITPVLGIVRSMETLRPNPAEVSRIFTVPLAVFCDEANAEVRTVSVNGFTRNVYYYHHDGETIWGATAFIIRDILRLLGLLA
jgi:8-oxo-dGTP pyrophosphatase MutT (NUDIX family)